jgi:hypothetical protein
MQDYGLLKKNAVAALVGAVASGLDAAQISRQTGIPESWISRFRKGHASTRPGPQRKQTNLHCVTLISFYQEKVQPLRQRSPQLDYTVQEKADKINDHDADPEARVSLRGNLREEDLEENIQIRQQAVAAGTPQAFFAAVFKARSQAQVAVVATFEYTLCLIGNVLTTFAVLVDKPVSQHMPSVVFRLILNWSKELEEAAGRHRETPEDIVHDRACYVRGMIGYVQLYCALYLKRSEWIESSVKKLLSAVGSHRRNDEDFYWANLLMGLEDLTVARISITRWTTTILTLAREQRTSFFRVWDRLSENPGLPKLSRILNIKEYV